MAGPVAERGDYLEVEQFGGDYTTPGFTVTDDHDVFPGSIVVHVGLARVAAAEAIVGIVEFSARNERGDDFTKNFGSPETWETAIYQKHLYRFTIGAYAARGVAKGWWYLQVWG